MRDFSKYTRITMSSSSANASTSALSRYTYSSACAWSCMEQEPTTAMSRSSSPCSTRAMPARLCSTKASAASGAGSHSCSSAGVSSGRTARMRMSLVRVASWVWEGICVFRSSQRDGARLRRPHLSEPVCKLAGRGESQGARMGRKTQT